MKNFKFTNNWFNDAVIDKFKKKCQNCHHEKLYKKKYRLF